MKQDVRQPGDTPHSMPYRQVDLADGVRFFHYQTDRFKRTRLVAFIHVPLAEEAVSAAALVPEVLQRGTRRHPTTQALDRYLSEMYGATLATGVQKVGDRQVIRLSLTVPEAPFVAEEPGVQISRGVALLRDLLTDPATPEGDRFNPDYVAQEKAIQTQRIRSLINNKARYARWRCTAHMFDGEPHGLLSLGTVDGVQAVTAADLYRYHGRLLRRHPVELVVFGRGDADIVEEAVRTHFDWQREQPAADLGAPGAFDRRGDLREIEESRRLQQGWLALGYRLGTQMPDKGYYAAAVCNGLFGGFPHSRLFLNVREGASLAYSARSAYDASKGVVYAVAGIDPGARDEALELIEEQVADLRDGRVSQDEMDATRRALVTRLQAAQDRPARVVKRHLHRRINGCVEPLEATVAGIEGTTIGQVVEQARELTLDTVYFLHGQE